MTKDNILLLFNSPR